MMGDPNLFNNLLKCSPGTGDEKNTESCFTYVAMKRYMVRHKCAVNNAVWPYNQHTSAERIHIVDVNGRLWYDLPDVLTPAKRNRTSHLDEGGERTSIPVGHFRQVDDLFGLYFIGHVTFGIRTALQESGTGVLF